MEEEEAHESSNNDYNGRDYISKLIFKDIFLNISDI